MVAAKHIGTIKSKSRFEKEDYYSEIIIATPENNELHQYCITYDESSMKGTSREGFRMHEINKYSTKAWGTIPLSSNEILDLSLSILKEKQIENFTVQYRTILDPRRNYKIEEGLLLPGYSNKDIHLMLIRSDYGHGIELRHVNIDLFAKNCEKISDPKNSFIEQKEFNIPFYEMALHLVFMQVEKHNPIIGPRYWLSPFQSHESRVDQTYRMWKASEMLTPLCILARNIHTRITLAGQYDEISEEMFVKTLSESISECREFEKENPDSVKVDFLSLGDGFILPFNLLLPEEDKDKPNLTFAFKYLLDGTKERIDFELMNVLM